MRHTEQAIRQMQEALDHARIADSNYIRGLRRALLFAVFIPNVIESGATDEEHRQWCEERMADLRGLLVEEWREATGHVNTMGWSRGPIREEFWDDIARALAPDPLVEA